jgi:hypothetical protein
MLTWLRQLQEYFQDNDNDWNKHGQYYGAEEPNKGETHEITEYKHVKPKVKQNENKPTVCTSL